MWLPIVLVEIRNIHVRQTRSGITLHLENILNNLENDQIGLRMLHSIDFKPHTINTVNFDL